MLALSPQQSLRIAGLPDGYRVVGVHGGAPLVREPSGQILRIQQDGRLTGTAVATGLTFADGRRRRPRQRSSVRASAPYTSVMD